MIDISLGFKGCKRTSLKGPDNQMQSCKLISLSFSVSLERKARFRSVLLRLGDRLREVVTIFGAACGHAPKAENEFSLELELKC